MKRFISMVCALILALLPAVSLAGLHTGQVGEEVRQLQQRLISLGLLTGTADGDYGQKTQNAVSEAQRLLILAGYEVTQTGAADDDTIALLYDESAEPALLTLCAGSKGARVKDAQNRLIDLKLMQPPADGTYGSATTEAVRQFQLKMEELGAKISRQDGVLDIDTYNLLFSDLSVYQFPAPVCFDATKPLSLTSDHLYGDACIVMEATSGKVLFEHNSHQRMYPASTTKTMTLLLALEMAELDAVVTIPQSAAEVPADSSLVPVYPGEQMTMDALLHGLMIRSGNDAANAVATLCSGSTGSFVDAMNQKAQQLGAYDTHFMNPHGYHDPEHYTTAYDLATITRAGLTDAQFCRIVTCLNYTLPETSKRQPLTLTCTHEIFNPESEYYIPYAAGVKSGYTSAAGFCYVGAAQTRQGTLIAVVLHAPTRNRAWQDMKKLFAFGYAAME